MAVKNKSAVKRHRQSEERRLRNKTVKSALRTVAKKIVQNVQKKDVEASKAVLLEMIKKIDTAARKGIVKKNAAARKKSRMQRLVNSLGA